MDDIWSTAEDNILFSKTQNTRNYSKEQAEQVKKIFVKSDYNCI